jgi:hypothetical protein
MAFGINFTEEERQEDLAHFRVHEAVVEKWEKREAERLEEYQKIKTLVEVQVKKLNNKKL